VIETVAIAVLAATSVLLFGFGLNLLYLTACSLRLKKLLPIHGVVAAQPPEGTAGGAVPRVCVQIPIYNERYVAERVLDAVCAIDWPPDRLEVQVLDDSDDDTVEILARRVALWRRLGVDVAHVRRASRTGFKAGALAHGLAQTDAELVAIFDADFVPPEDFLARTVPTLDDPEVAFVQARWGHLDEGYSWFTRLQALFIDFHFLVEQAVRSSRGYFTNFTGSAGVWRRSAIEDSGGWTAATLTEDLDLSYRARLRGWKSVYLEDLVVPEELPVSIDAYRSQQSRWATGSFQCAFRLLGPVWRSRNPLAVKLQATIHLLAYGVGPLMLVQLACYPALLLTVGRQSIPWQLSYALLLGVAVAASPWIGFVVAQTRRGRSWRFGLPAVFCQVVGAGMALNVVFALVAALRPGGKFVRTPKHRIVQPGQEWRDQAYVVVGDPRALFEAVAGFSALAIVPLATQQDQPTLAVYASLFAVGFLVIASLSLVDFLEVLAVRRPGLHLLAALRAVGPPALVVSIAGLALLAASQLPEPFEDGYGHWLIAANLASTGNLVDPMFGMEDTWLPGYHLVAGAALHIFGIWQLGILKALSALFGIVTAACVYALAPNRRQATVAVALLVLNPVFLFTSGDAVVEPLMTALLVAAALAAVRGKMKLAAVLAALACATSTKAWIWVGAVLVFAAVEATRSRSAQSRRALTWVLPAVAVLAIFQLGFAPASHSVARGAVEVVSASARGSLPAGSLARVTELAATYGLAALPLLAFGAVGAVVALRAAVFGRRVSGMWRFLYVPSILYLGVVFGLVAAGAYSGSHRYLYPALPAFALLAAAALDRYTSQVRLATVAASSMLAVAFMPVFGGFAAQNAGLAAAGLASACTSGSLVTDSPVAAYFSGKRPAQITGSQALPLDRPQALDWMRAHDVTSLVVENISYYRATAIFPDLAQGNASPPFVSLGGTERYQVSGGKATYAYGLGAGCLEQTILPGVEARLQPVPAQGKTAALAKGLALSSGGAPATGEGMGFGVPIVHYSDGWIYPRTFIDADVSTASRTIWKRTFQLDEIGGDAGHGYGFVPTASRGQVEVTYAFDDGGVAITVRPLWLVAGYSEVGVLNEQSAAFDDFAAEHQPALLGSAFGRWVPVTGHWARLRSGSLRVEWAVTAIPGAQLNAGRELAPPDFDWAGLDYIFPAKFAGTTYRINVQEAR
jgi:cellulose synthase/poly-beta-1,6-N-acetylglucosamine synthase-like glycosyltransferase